MNNILIRKATIADIQNIKLFMLEALGESPTAFSAELNEYKFNSDDWWNSYLSGYFYSIKDKMFLAIDNNTIVGMVGIVYEFKARRKHVANIVWMYVKNDYRRRGISKLLFNNLLTNLDKDIKKLSLMVNDTQKPAIKLYESLGFNISGRLKNDLLINNQYVDTLIMEMFI